MLGCGLMLCVSFLAKGETWPWSHPQAWWQNSPFPDLLNQICVWECPSIAVHLWKLSLNGRLNGLTASGDSRLTQLRISSRHSMWALKCYWCDFCCISDLFSSKITLPHSVTELLVTSDHGHLLFNSCTSDCPGNTVWVILHKYLDFFGSFLF